MKTTLRILTCGSVDDGKSTLIGRLLQDADLAKEDQLADAKKVSEAKGANNPMAYMCDGLQEEREKGITIDVAHRYFETDRHKYIIRDCPGHAEYQQNMTTGCSQADIAIVMTDSTRGPEGCITDQTIAHFETLSLFAIPRVIVCVNKLDTIPDPGQRNATFIAIHQKITELARKTLQDCKISIMAVSALTGANIVHTDPTFPDSEAGSLFDRLETMEFPPNSILEEYEDCFQVTDVMPAEDDSIFVQGKMLAGQMSVGYLLGVADKEEPDKRTLCAAFVGETSPRKACQAGLSYTLKLGPSLEPPKHEIKRGTILVSKSRLIAARGCVPVFLPRQSLLELRFSILQGNPVVVGSKIKLQICGQKAIAKVTHIVVKEEERTQMKKGDRGLMYVELKDPLTVHPYYPPRHPLGAATLISYGTDETLGVGMITMDHTWYLRSCAQYHNKL